MSTQMNINKICRVCLRSKDLRSLHGTFENNQTYADILNEFTTFQVSRYDELPQHICGNCEIAANLALKFKRKCEQSYSQLLKILQLSSDYKKVKVELNEKSDKYTQTVQSTYPACGHCEEKYFSCDTQMIDREEDEENAIICRFCDKSYNHTVLCETAVQSSNLCPICKRQFTLRQHLIRHLTLIHKIVKFDSENIENDIDGNNFKKLSETQSNLYDNESKTNDVANLDDYTLGHTDSDDENDKPLSVLQNSKKSAQTFENDANKHVVTCEYNENSNNSLQRSDKILEHDETLDNDSSNNSSQNRELSPNQNNTAYPCTMCTKVFKNAKLPCKDMKNRHDVAQQIYCSQCDKAFAHSTLYQRHKETKHKEKTHKCSICDKNFSTKMYLQRHMIRHEKKRFACKECTQICSTKDELNAHIKAEGHDRPLLCPECGLRCKTSNILMVHMRRHKGEKPFKCKFCSKGFPRIDDLRIHEKYHTGEKSHFCETCGKGFQRKYNLTIHLRVHTGEKPYKCPHCPQAFAQGNDLKAHIRRHTGERFRCEHCGAAFLQGYQIRQHKLSEHGIREDPPTQRVAKFTSTEAQELQIKQNLQRELKLSVDDKTLEESNLNIELDSLALDISEIPNSNADIVDVSNFCNIEF